MEHTMSRKRAYMEQQWGIPWSSNGAYHGVTMGHTMEYTMSRKRAYIGAAMGHIWGQ